MDILLYNVSDSPNVVNKSGIKQSQGKRISGVRFKEENALDVVNPKILLNLTEEVAKISAYNYVEIPRFTRYYFIDDISTRGGLVEISCRCDVLTSFAKDIKRSSQLVARCSNKKLSKQYMTDSEYPLETRNDYYVKNFGSQVSDPNCIYCILETAGKGGNI